MSVADIEKRIRFRYKKFFSDLQINPKTGIVKSDNNLKFATYPFVGSKYAATKLKILFIGLDLGKDESKKILEFKPKRKVVERMYDDIKKMNVHIAGTCISTLWLWGRRDGFRGAKSYKAAIKIFKERHGTKNPLSQIAFTNLFKFVTRNRIHRFGGGDRRHILKKAEEQLLLDEIMILSPRVIIFQSLRFNDLSYNMFFDQLRNRIKNLKVFIAPHPSYHGIRAPLPYIKKWRVRF
ncbi:MAG: hypothetical protein Q7R94_00315 [bacterium]|nr:hypothetical protein [bacterium]